MKNGLFIVPLAVALTIGLPTNASAASCQVADKTIASGKIVIVFTKEEMPPNFKPIDGVSIDWIVVSDNAAPCQKLYGHGPFPTSCESDTQYKVLKEFSATGRLVLNPMNPDSKVFLVESITCN